MLCMVAEIRIKELEEYNERLLRLEKIIEALAETKEPEYYTMKQACEKLNRSYSTVYRLIQRGLIKPIRANRDFRIHRDDLAEFRKRVTF